MSLQEQITNAIEHATEFTVPGTPDPILIVAFYDITKPQLLSAWEAGDGEPDQALVEENANLVAQVTALGNELNITRQELDVAKSHEQTLGQELIEARQELAVAQRSIENLGNELAEKAATIDQQHENIVELGRLANARLAEINDLKNDINTITERRDHYIETVADRDNEIADLRNEYNTLADGLTAETRKREQAEEQVDRLADELAETKAQIEEKLRQVARELTERLFDDVGLPAPEGQG